MIGLIVLLSLVGIIEFPLGGLPPAYAQATTGQTLTDLVPKDRGRVVDSCWSCHQNDKFGRAHQAGIHYAFGVGCADCHGGDPTKTKREEAESEAAGFTARISAFDIPELCAKCHGKPDTVKWSRARRNAFEEYKHGAHAETLWTKEDSLAPQCVTCHGAHRILRVDDPESPAHPANVNQTCAKCHANDEYELEFEFDITIPDRVARSVHGLKGAWNPDLRLPTCASCHGAHWNVGSWERQEVFGLCGTCHTPERQAFGPDNPHVIGQKKVHCVTCHGEHEIKPPTPEMFRDPMVCAACHSAKRNPDDSALDYIARTLKAVAPVTASIERSRAALQKLQKAGFQPLQEAERVNRAERALLTGFGRVQHRLIMQQNLQELEAAGAQAKAAEAAVVAIRSRHRWTRIALCGGAVYLVLLGGILWIRQRH